MKITRKQLRRLIEGSIKKRGDYVIPVEDPIRDPLKDLDYDEDQKAKLKTLALSGDQETMATSDVLADIGGYESIDRFGVDTFSKHVQADDLGINMLDDLDIDSAISKACDYWIYDHKDELSYFDNIDQDSFRKYADYMIEGYDHDQVLSEIKMYTTEVLDKRIKSLIDISNSAAAVPPVDEKIAKLENAKKLFSSSHNNPVIDDHVMFKFKSVLYKFYLDWKSYYETEQGYDMNNPDHIARYKKNISTFKESKMRLTRRQLRRLIESYIIDDKGNVVSADDAYDVGLDTAAAAIDKSRAKAGKSPVGQTLVRASDPETVRQGLEFADALEAEYSDFERTAVDMSDEDRQPNRPMTKLDSYMKAKYGQGRAMGEVYSLVVRDNMGKEVLIPIIDDHSEEEKKRGEGIPEDTMFIILDLYRQLKKQKTIIKQLAPELDEGAYELAIELLDLEEREYTGHTFSPQEKRLYEALERFNRAESALKYYYFEDLLSNHVHEVLSYPPYNYSYQNAKNFELLRIEPRHEELETALEYASGID